MSATATSTPGTIAPGRHKPKHSDRARAERRLGLTLVAPAAIVMLAVSAYPIIYAFVLSLQRADLRFPDANKFIGFDNYKTVLTSALWWQDLWHTIVLTVIPVTFELILGMGLALVMHRIIFGRGPVRAIAL